MRDLFWIKKAIENGDCTLEDAVEASDNPFMFRFRDYIGQSDECLYMNDSLDITAIDTDAAIKEIEEVAAQVEEATNLENKVSFNSLMYIQCLLDDGVLDAIDCDNYTIDRNFNLFKK